MELLVRRTFSIAQYMLEKQRDPNYKVLVEQVPGTEVRRAVIGDSLIIEIYKL